MDATAIFTIKHLPHKPFSLSSLSLSKDLLTSSSSIRHSQKLFKVASSSSGTRDGVVFDEAAYETERLALDAEARESMAEASEGDDPKAWKWVIRKRVWDLMEAQNIAQFPRPVHHRIPNFVGASVAADKVQNFPPYVVTSGKQLLTPQPRLRTGFFSILDSSMLTPSTIKEACTSVGVAKYGRPIRLDEKIKVDIIVIGSVAVDPKTGARLGKGEALNRKGFAELEYGMLRYMGAIDDSTPVVTSVHDQQLVDDIPIEKLLIHDVPVDIICTPTQEQANKLTWHLYHDPKNLSNDVAAGIYWDKLSPEKLGQIRILRELKGKIEQETGQKLPTGPSEKLPPTARRKR
ncbi:hypothetical protein RJ639_000600 [Escallonia herrerae]|uniref:5-formyltetrahydrofolate cyclo-ligase n=1 Tax=Escallonia herrerae TaxID=1293975 RepID=A0AA88XD15_9ASTE|nr:hypothetical protein RJ639_000600 [Escallonia herrerae]